jgi:hypothetical protein
LILDLFLKKWKALWFWFYGIIWKIKTPFSSQDSKHPLMNFVGVSAMH